MHTMSLRGSRCSSSRKPLIMPWFLTPPEPRKEHRGQPPPGAVKAICRPWGGGASCGARGGPTWRSSSRRCGTWRAWPRYVSCSAASARPTWRTSTRTRPTGTCTASLLCGFAGELWGVNFSYKLYCSRGMYSGVSAAFPAQGCSSCCIWRVAAAGGGKVEVVFFGEVRNQVGLLRLFHTWSSCGAPGRPWTPSWLA